MGWSRFLLMLQDISEVFVRRNIVPICMHCKMIRDDHDNWNNAEAFFDEEVEVVYSHGICPTCLKIHYQRLYEKIHN